MSLAPREKQWTGLCTHGAEVALWTAVDDYSAPRTRRDVGTVLRGCPGEQRRRRTIGFREVRARTPTQEQAISSLDPEVLARVLEIWLKVVIPGASFELPGAMPRLICFRIR